MSLFSLNDDVLLAIFANLHGEDALNVSLTSKRAYRLAGPRIAARINCSSPAELRRLHTYLLSDLPDDTPRARSLEHLVIDTSTFEAAENDDDSSYYGDDFSQAKLIGDILLQARNLRELSFERFQPCLERDPRIGDAIRSLTSLVNVRLFTISDSSLSVFDSFRSDQLARLTLSYYVEDDFPLENQTKTLAPLISVLSSLNRLRIVKLWNFDPIASLAREVLPSMPSLPSIRYLRLSDTSVPALDMVELCPALSTLIVSFSWEAEPMPVSEGPKWPPLRRLMVAELGDVLRFSTRLRTVDQLQISGLLRLWDSPGFSEYGPAQQPLLELLRSTSPVSLFICVETTCQEEDLWGELSRAAPRLRSLELQLEGLVPVHVEDYSWLVRAPPCSYLSFAHKLMHGPEQTPRRPQRSVAGMPPGARSRAEAAPVDNGVRIEGRGPGQDQAAGGRPREGSGRTARPARARPPLAALSGGRGHGAEHAALGRGRRRGRLGRCAAREGRRGRLGMGRAAEAIGRQEAVLVADRRRPNWKAARGDLRVRGRGGAVADRVRD